MRSRTLGRIRRVLALGAASAVAALAPAMGDAAGYKDVVMGMQPWAYWGLGETTGTSGAAVDHVGTSNGTYVGASGTNVFERGTLGTPLVGKWDGGIRGQVVPESIYTGGHVLAVAPSRAGQQPFSANVWVRWEGYQENPLLGPASGNHRRLQQHLFRR